MIDHLERLKDFLPESERSRIPPCIEELVVERPFLKAQSDEEYRPSRQDITQFLAAWFKHIGLSKDECLQWLVEFCTDVLSAISSSSISQIRHSTKSNLKYIYNYDISFEYELEKTQSTEGCETRYPVHIQRFMEANKGRSKKMLSSGTTAMENGRAPKEKPVKPKPIPVREKYREQFMKAVQYIEKKAGQGISKKVLVSLLNEQGFRTANGRPWTYGILSFEIKRHGITVKKKSGNC